MRLLILRLSLAARLVVAVHGQTANEKTGLHIQKCSSGIDYPTKGDESVDVNYAGITYHMRILHPKVMEELHFSTPFFWIGEKDESSFLRNIVTVKAHIGVLSWHSISGYFFAENLGALRGFFLENGVDSANSGSSGLIFVHDGKESTAWSWKYDRARNKSKGTYRIVSADELAKPFPPHLLKALAPLLNHAEKEADAWPGP